MKQKELHIKTAGIYKLGAGIVMYFFCIAEVSYCQQYTWYHRQDLMGKAIFLSLGSGKPKANSWYDALHECELFASDNGFLATLKNRKYRRAVVDYVLKQLNKAWINLGKFSLSDVCLLLFLLQILLLLLLKAVSYYSV